MRLLLLTVPLLVSRPAHAGSGGPDAGDLVYTDSDAADGPPYVWLDATGGYTWSLGRGESASLTLPFAFTLYGTPYDAVTVGADGVLFFDGASSAGAPVCPSTTAGAVGVAAFWDADVDAATVYTRTFGRWPDRTFVVSWDDVTHTRAPGLGAFQVWLVEGRDAVVVVHGDTDFGDTSVDGGANAVVGVFGDGAGLAWSCFAARTDGASAWFGDVAGRPSRADVPVDTLDAGPWHGTADFVYAGRALAGGDVNGDEVDDLLVGNENNGNGRAYLAYRPDVPSDLSDAEATFQGATSGDALGAAVLIADLDGDGLGEPIVGASKDDRGVALAGAAYVWPGGGYLGTYAVSDASDAWLGASSGRPAVGAALAAGDVDGDGYADLLVGSPTDDGAGTDAGAVYLARGGTLGAGARSVTTADAQFSGAPGDELGRAITAGDLDGDGADELILGAPYGDGDAVDGGAVWLLAGGAWSGAVDVPTASACGLTGTNAGGRFGDAVALGDLDGGGTLDLMVGAPTWDGAAGSNAGRAFRFADVGPAACPAFDMPDATLDGSASSANFGDSLVVADVDADGDDDLVVAAPNANAAAVGGGAAYIFRAAPSGALSDADADHRVMGIASAGALGTALAVASDGDGGTTLLASAPFASYGGTSDGAVYAWRWRADFADADGDGFVDAASGGNDCDDADASAYPGADDVDGDGIDGDCDGWVDGRVAIREDEAGWAWDVAAVGATSTERYDFEDLAEGSALGTYGGLSIGAGLVADLVYGAFPEDSLGARIVAGTSNTLTLALGAGVDAVAFRLLDPNGAFTLVATGPSGTVVPSQRFTASGEDLPGGLFRGFTFADTVTTVQITAAAYDGFGIDDLEVAWSDTTDRDRDGWSEDAGDCDDADPAISPVAREDYGNGVDDDCDGVIDAGTAETWSDASLWADAAALGRTTTVDFEDLALGDAVTTDYLDLGVLFDGGASVADSVGTTLAVGTRAGAVSRAVTLSFFEAQAAIALTLLDSDRTVTVTGRVDGEDAYTRTVGGAGGTEFVGFTFELPVDELVLTGTETFGVDDVLFEGLGQDDADGDGLTEADGDCDDADATIFPGADDAAYDGVDADCAGDIRAEYDADGDGITVDFDCDDGDASSYPGAPDAPYDGVDSDCAGPAMSDYDADGDGHDDWAWGGDDCDDADGSVSPSATEVWYDGVDGDCAGDDDFDADGDGVSMSGTFSASTDCDDGDPSAYPGAEEMWYDGVDSDCSGAAESDYDFDGDGYDAEAWGGTDCEDDDATVYLGAASDRCYDGVDQDCDGHDDYDCDGDGYASDRFGGEDCDDADAAVHPGVADAPRDGVDANCDGAPEYDDDGDGLDGVEDGGSDCDDTRADVFPGAEDACYDGLDADCGGDDDDDCDRDGAADLARGGTDCDDADGAIHPGARDFPYDGTDHDCDDAAEFDVDDDGAPSVWYGGDDCDDADPDVYVGAPDAWYDGVDADCDAADDCDADGDGARWDGAGGTDCDDGDATVGPGAAEVVGDGVDQDCDGADATACTDCDGDGFTDGVDCDDTDARIFPGASDRPYDGVDTDCTGDDDYDADGDGARAAAWGGADCDDADAERRPGRADVCGGGDEDCDGAVDEDCGADTGAETDTGAPDSGGDSGYDSGEPDNGGDSGSGDSGHPDSGGGSDTDDAPVAPPDLVEPEAIPREKRGYGCAAADGRGNDAGLLLVAVASLAARRRRRG